MVLIFHHARSINPDHRRDRDLGTMLSANKHLYKCLIALLPPSPRILVGNKRSRVTTNTGWDHTWIIRWRNDTLQVATPSPMLILRQNHMTFLGTARISLRVQASQNSLTPIQDTDHSHFKALPHLQSNLLKRRRSPSHAQVNLTKPLSRQRRAVNSNMF